MTGSEDHTISIYDLNSEKASSSTVSEFVHRVRSEPAFCIIS